MREETFGPFVPRTFWGVAVAVVLIAVLVPIRAFPERGGWRCLYRAIDRARALVDVMLSEHRDLAAAKVFYRSAKAVTGVTPDRVTTARKLTQPSNLRC
jgi:hypothetical protein